MYKQGWISILLGSALMSAGAVAQTCTNPAIPESTRDGAFIFDDVGTAIHKTTGLMWKRCLEGQTFKDSYGGDFWDDHCMGTPLQYNWQAALERAQTVNGGGGFAGYADWRLPNLKELGSIVEYCQTKPALNGVVFPDPRFPADNSGVWSSSTDKATSADSAWSIEFERGYDTLRERKTGRLVRLVRSAW